MSSSPEQLSVSEAVVSVTGDERSRRLLGAVIAIAAAGLLLVAAWVDPDPSGIGTHEQLNLPACGWITIMNVPCPTCGMTTAFAHAADGNMLRSLRTQPLGGLLAIGVAAALLLGAYTAVTGSRVGVLLARLWGPRTGWFLAALLVAAWAYKIVSHRFFPVEELLS